jgi:hypothetical protein
VLALSSAGLSYIVHANHTSTHRYNRCCGLPTTPCTPTAADVGTLPHMSTIIAVDSRQTLARARLVSIVFVQIVDRHLSEMGIYRISGNAGDMQRLKKECDENVFTATYNSTQEVHAVSGLLKLYFRELADPLFTNALYDDFMLAAREAEASTREREVRRLVLSLPVAHLTTLEFVMRHLLRVMA